MRKTWETSHLVLGATCKFYPRSLAKPGCVFVSSSLVSSCDLQTWLFVFILDLCFHYGLVWGWDRSWTQSLSPDLLYFPSSDAMGLFPLVRALFCEHPAPAMRSSQLLLSLDVSFLSVLSVHPGSFKLSPRSFSRCISIGFLWNLSVLENMLLQVNWKLRWRPSCQRKALEVSG